MEGAPWAHPPAPPPAPRAPRSYGARSLAQNEFLSPSYQIYPSALPTTASLLAAVPGAGSLPGAQYIVAVGEPQAQGAWYFTSPTCGAHPALQCTGHSYGSQALLDLNINLHYEWKWGGVGYLIGFAGLMVAIGTRAVSKKARAPPGRSGSTYSKDAAEAGTDVTTALLAQADRGKLKAEKDRAAAGGGGPGLPTTADASSVLPFQPLSVAWRSLRYTVDTAEGARTLLNGVSGVALPGRLVALMGASGAGKTTLLDVVACRKTAGSVEGEIFAGGYPMEPRSFARATAYCEQQDIHSALATVAEALDFSAALRLPASVSRATRSAFVEEMIDLLELRPLAGRLVGVPEDPASLSPAQRKLLTIAVELVSNAPVLFLDEPTSGARGGARAAARGGRRQRRAEGAASRPPPAPPPFPSLTEPPPPSPLPPPPCPSRNRATGLDARAAVVVIRVVRRIASTGRTCVTTVHQPSADVYSNFDDLCLLQRGGYQAWFGPTGPAFEAHLSALPGAHPLPEGMNPASWMLDVLAGVDSSVGTDRPSMDFGGGAPAAAAAAAAVGDGIAPRAEERPQAGPALQEALRASAQWAALESALEGACAPAPGAAPLAAGGAFARAFPAQLGLVLRRAWRSYNRALSYNVARVKSACALRLPHSSSVLFTRVPFLPLSPRAQSCSC